MRARLLLFGLTLSLSAAPAFDVSGLSAFWPVWDELRQNREPSRAAWDSLFATPGYAQLETREHRRRAIETAIRAAAEPTQSGLRDSILKTGGFGARSFRHLLGLAAARDSLAAFQRTLLTSGVIEGARRAVSAYLPRGLTDSVAPPPIALIFFADDGRGYPDLVIVDLLRLMRTGIDTGFFAHELFHYYRRKIPGSDAALDPRDEGIDELLAYPAEEGIADQLDKRRWIRGPLDPVAPPYAAEYRAAYNDASGQMARVSHALELAVTPNDSATAVARRTRDSLPDQGRALGAYMAATIDSVFGRPALIAVVRTPFQFWLRYDSAAARVPGAPRLSSHARRTLVRLDAKR